MNLDPVLLHLLQSNPADVQLPVAAGLLLLLSGCALLVLRRVGRASR